MGIPHLISCRRATAAAEMALVSPLLIILMFGSFEMGNYFLSEHVVVKAVRDGARYAARQPFSAYIDPATNTCRSEVSDAIRDKIQLVTRTGKTADDGETRLAGWDDDDSVTVTVACEPTVDSEGATAYSGIYDGMDMVPIVNVSVSGLDYISLFNDLGFTSSTVTLNAEAQAVVMGI